MAINTAVPVFNFGSKELENFFNAHSYNQVINPQTRIHPLWGYEYQNPAKPIERKVWVMSGIHYIINHGSFSDYRTSVGGQQHSQVVKEWLNK